MLLSTQEFRLKAESIAKSPSGEIGIDLETTGLSPYQGDQAFLIGFTDTDGAKFSAFLSPESRDALQIFLSNKNLRYCAHNASFEMHFFAVQFDLFIQGVVWDSLVMARIECNKHLSYSLQACASRLGLSKHEAMLEWLKQRGNKAAYHRAPHNLIIPYVEQDAWLSWRLRRHQLEVFKHWDTATPDPIHNVVDLEKEVLPVLFDMERNGLLIDVAYCKRALEYEQKEKENAAMDFRSLSGVGFVDSRKTLQPVFDAHGISYGHTGLGNASFTEECLKSGQSHPVVAALMRHRRSLKRSSAYWSNFLELEHNGIIHPSIHQNKAQTGRMSVSSPSCQNWATDEDEGTAYPIRRAFIARPGCRIASLDYSQMELRKGADEAEDSPMIERIEAGADLHQEIADMAGVPRSLAKNGRFAKQYGAGIPKIAATLGVSEAVARTISEAIDRQSARMTAYSYSLQHHAKRNGFLKDWLGRRFYFDPGFEYKAFNYRIQGGCAEILKLAILDIDKFLKQHASKESFMLMVVHDEIIFNLHEDDLRLLPELRARMIAAHKDKKHLAMDVGIEIGFNLHDLEKVKI